MIIRVAFAKAALFCAVLFAGVAVTFLWQSPTVSQWVSFAIGGVAAGACGYYVALATRRRL